MDQGDVILATVESALMHMQRINRRLSIITTVALVLVAMMFCTFMYFLTSYEISTEEITVDSKSGPANYIGNDNNGDINNGISDSKEKNNKGEE